MLAAVLVRQASITGPLGGQCRDGAFVVRRHASPSIPSSDSINEGQGNECHPRFADNLPLEKCK